MGFIITKDSIYINPEYRKTLQQPCYPRKQNVNTRATRRVEHPQLYKYMFQEGYTKENSNSWTRNIDMRSTHKSRELGRDNEELLDWEML